MIIATFEEKKHMQVQTQAEEHLKNIDNDDFVNLCKEGKIDDIKLLLVWSGNIIDINYNNGQPIQMAAHYGHFELVKFLLEKGADPSINNNILIVWASSNGHHELVKILLMDSRVDPSTGDNFPIQCASQNGHHEVVKILLEDPRVDSISERDRIAN